MYICWYIVIRSFIFFNNTYAHSNTLNKRKCSLTFRLLENAINVYKKDQIGVYQDVRKFETCQNIPPSPPAVTWPEEAYLHEPEVTDTRDLAEVSQSRFWVEGSNHVIVWCMYTNVTVWCMYTNVLLYEVCTHICYQPIRISNTFKTANGVLMSKLVFRLVLQTSLSLCLLCILIFVLLCVVLGLLNDGNIWIKLWGLAVAAV